jgi:subtilase family serine protease
LPPGDTIKVCADTFNTVDEWNETNNCLENELTCKPDLIIEDKKEIWDACNRTYTVQYTVKNDGNATAGASNTRLTLDGVEVATDPVPALKPCETHTATFAWTHECTPVTEIIEVCADMDDVVDEWDETNNCKENEIKCKPDLVIEDKWEEFMDDGEYKVSYTIKNKGNATALKGHSTRLYVDGQPKECKAVPVDLKPCENYTDTFIAIIKCTPPKDNITVCADDCDGGVVDEWNETNNCLENDLACGPDLVVESKMEIGTEEEGKYTVTYTIHNKGTATADAGHTTALFVNGIEKEKKLVPEDLDPCERYTDTFDTVIMCTPPGDTIMVCADNCNVIEEVNETNNCLENYLPCGPDLVVTEKWEEWINETHYNVSFTIKNQGDMTAHYPFWIELLVFDADGLGDYTGEGGTVVGDLPVQGDGLAPGETWTDTFDIAIECTPLSDTIIVYVDCFDEVVETNEENNWLENDLLCRLPDLVITDKEEEWVQAAGNYIVHYTIKNIGNMTAPAGHDTTLKVDGVEVDHKEVPVALAPGATYTDTFDAVIMITRPSDTIVVCADNFDEVLELDETNNCLENEWEYEGKPDLVIKNKWEKDRRGTYTVYFEIKNIGTAPTPRRVRHYAVLFVDGVEIAQKGIRRTLDPGETYKSHFRTRITPSGAFDTIRVCADKYDDIDELNEENNCLVNIHP